MVHARKDYNRIQDPQTLPGMAEAMVNAHMALQDSQAGESALRQALGGLLAVLDPLLVPIPAGSTPIGPDEPVFLVRAKDNLFADAVQAYIELYTDTPDKADVSLDMLRCLGHLVVEGQIWQFANGCKRPDMPAGQGAL